MNTYITLDGFKYAVVAGTYIRKWDRFFTSQVAANIVRLNYIDRGPGIRVYTMSLYLVTWAPNSIPYKDGITQTAEEQMAQLENSYAKITKSLQYLDPFGNPPSASSGVFFTDLQQIIPQYASDQKPYIVVDIQLTESTQTID